MTILIADNSPRISYTATSGQTAFTVPFEFFDNTDLNVYINDTLQTLTTHYTVTGGSGSTGSITLVTGATAGDVVVITRDVTLERTTDFPTSGPFQVASLNTELDKVVAMIADMKDLAERGLRLSDSDTTTSLTLASKDARKGTVLAFNETTGAVEIGPTIADTNTIAQIKADIALLADIQDGTVATNAITTVSSISSDVTTVSSNNANVTIVAGNTTNINTVATNDSNITTVAGQTTNMQNVTDNLTAIQNAATNAANAASSASDALSHKNAAETAESNAQGHETNASGFATTAQGHATTAQGHANTATTKAGEASTSASNALLAQQAAESARDSALASFDSFDDRYLGAKTSDPTVDNDGNALVAGALYFNSTDGEMKVYNGTSWVDAYADGASLVAKSGDTMTGNLTFANNRGIIFGDNDELSISSNGTTINAELDSPAEFNLFTNGGDAQLNIDANVAGGAGLQLNCTTTGGHQIINAAQASVPFQLQHGGTTKLSIDGTGIGIGTTSPSHPLHVYNSSAGTVAEFRSNDGTNNPRFSIYGDSSGTHLHHTWSSGASNLIFEVGGSAGSNEKMRIDSSGAEIQGNLIIDNQSPVLEFQPDGNYTPKIDFSDGGEFTYATAVNTFYWKVGGNSGRLSLDSSGNLIAAGNVTAYSDERLKDNIETLDGSKVYEMRGVSFTKEGEAGSGVIAQELQKIAPELVHEQDEYLSVAYGNLVGYLIEAVKDLKAEIEELKNGSTN